MIQQCRISRQKISFPHLYALAAIGGTTGYYNPYAACCIAGIVLYYSRLDGASTQGFLTEKKLEMSEGLQAMCLYTQDGPQVPGNGTWVNTMVDVHAPADCKLFCASISGGAGQVAMPSDVRAILYDSSGKKIPESDTSQCRIRNYQGNFYQLFEENSGERNYRFHICMQSNARDMPGCAGSYRRPPCGYRGSV